MKKKNIINHTIVILAFITGMTYWGCAGTPPSEPATQKEMFIRIVSDVPGFSKDQLFQKSKEWVAKAYSTALDVIQHSDRNSGTVVGKTYIPHVREKKFGQKDKYECRFTIIIETKDNKIRTTFMNLHLVGGFGIETILKSDMEEIKPKLETSIERLIASFSINTQNDDW